MLLDSGIKWVGQTRSGRLDDINESAQPNSFVIMPRILEPDLIRMEQSGPFFTSLFLALYQVPLVFHNISST